MDEDIEETLDTTPPPTINHTGRRAATSTYDVYVVHTPKNDGGGGGGNPKRRCKGHHNGGTGNDDASNGVTGNGDAANGGAANGGAGNNGADKKNDKVNGDEDDPKDDDDYNLEAEEERSLDVDEYGAFEEPPEGPQLETLCRQLASTAKSIKNKSRHLKKEEDELNGRWTELLQAEHALEDKLEQTGTKRSYLQRNLLDKMDAEADDSTLSKHEWAEGLDRPPRGRSPRPED